MAPNWSVISCFQSSFSWSKCTSSMTVWKITCKHWIRKSVSRLLTTEKTTNMYFIFFFRETEIEPILLFHRRAFYLPMSRACIGRSRWINEEYVFRTCLKQDGNQWSTFFLSSWLQTPKSSCISSPFLNVCGITADLIRLQKYRMLPKIISLKTADFPRSGSTTKSPLK